MLALSVGIGVSSGAIPSGGGKIYGCFANSGGGVSPNGEIARVLFDGAILAPNGTPVGWSAGFSNPSSTPQFIEAQAICLTA